MSPSKITPMLKQYLSIKEAYKDSILFYRMGDFYEMFFEDAETASRILEITLTSRNKKDESPIPMCGVPARAVRGYMARLIESGYKVAICDQIEDPALAKGLVKRDVVRVITPGMILEDEFLDNKSNNFLLGLSRSDLIVGLAYLDISTGTFRVAESQDLGVIEDESLRVSPSEILLPESVKNDPVFLPILKSFSENIITYLDDKVFDYHSGRNRLTEQFNTLSLEGFGCENLRAGVGTAGAILYYVQETQKQKIEHLNGIETYNLDNFLVIDDISCRNLELLRNLRTGTRQGTLISVIDRTNTNMGGRLLKRWLRYPLLDVSEIESRLAAVDEAKHNMAIRRRIRETLKSVYDLERLGSKIVMGHCNARDLNSLKHSLTMLPEIFASLLEFESDKFEFTQDVAPLAALAELIENAIREEAPPVVNEGGMIRRGYNSELDELIQISSDGKGYLARLEAKEKENTGITSLKVRYNKVFGYYIEVSKTHSDTVPPHYVRKQTLVNAERYITDELKKFEDKVLGAEEQRARLEYEIFGEIRGDVRRHNKSIQETAQFIAQLDCLLSLAEIADQESYVKPAINTDGQIFIKDGRHPVVEKMLTGERFVPNTVYMDDIESQVLIITGPNMAGKSTVLRQTALMVLMAQMGSFIPAAWGTVCVTDRIFTRVGALDNLSQGLSTFLVEMQETANILHNATEQSLVVMDEIGRGTSTFDGLSIAWAVAEYLHDLRGQGVKTLFATHYHELTNLANLNTRVKNYNIAVKEWNDEIIFLRKLVEGGTNRSYGIQVSRLAGIPEKVIKRAKKILFNIEDGENSLRSLSNLSGDQPDSKNGHMQLNLFPQPEHFVIEKLQQLDLSKMTPLEALNVLNELQEKAKTIVR
ncbi:DNA mismatch repair protein MutS [Thermodesulfobacteriota bacterium]